MPAESFCDYVLDQLSGVGDVRARAMFGGHGLYLGSRFFGIVHRGRLYFRTGERTRPQYEARGMRPFRPSPRQTLASYFEVPAEVVEDPERLVEWGLRAAAVRGEGRRAGARKAGLRRGARRCGGGCRAPRRSR